MSNDVSAARSFTIGDSANAAAPIGELASRINPDVIIALARWRGIDSHNLYQLGSALTTHSGSFAADSSGYLNALHGFVAEQITYNTFAPGHTTVFPEATTVPGWDIKVDGDAVQIKEGAHAASLVHEALKRYPQFRHFFTDPQTASKLRSEGIDAEGVPGLEPDQIAAETSATLYGTDALVHAGMPQLPILTTLTVLLRRFVDVQEGRLDLSTAARTGAIDIGSRGLGLALGIKAAALGITALGAFPLAIVALPAAGIAGALGLQHFVNRRREDQLDILLDDFFATRDAAEQSADILVGIARTKLVAAIEKLRSKNERRVSQLERDWAKQVAEAETISYQELIRCADILIAQLPPNERCAITTRFTQAVANVDSSRRLAALDIAIEEHLIEIRTPERSSGLANLNAVRKAYQNRCADLRRVQTTLETELADTRKVFHDSTADVAIDTYTQIMKHTTILFEHVIEAFTRVDTQLAKLGREGGPVEFSHG